MSILQDRMSVFVVVMFELFTGFFDVTMLIIMFVMFAQFLRHPNIVGWIGIVGTFPGLGKTEPALTVGSMFEYCEGGQLNNLIHTQKVQFSSAQKLSMMTDIAMGLSYLHAQNIIHRDLSTRNLLLQDSKVKLCDFGCARRLTFGSNSITPKMIMGSPSWMSPEQISGQPLTLKSDVFSYGTIMWEIATGLVPHDKADENFTAPSALEVFKAAIYNGLNPRLPSAGHMPDCSPSVLSDLNRLLILLSQHSPDLRPTSEQARRIITQIAKGVCSDMNDTPIEGNVSRLFMWLEDRMHLGLKIIEFFKKYNPTKMSTLPELLANFVGTEVEMSDHARLGPHGSQY